MTESRSSKATTNNYGLTIWRECNASVGGQCASFFMKREGNVVTEVLAVGYLDTIQLCYNNEEIIYLGNSIRDEISGQKKIAKKIDDLGYVSMVYDDIMGVDFFSENGELYVGSFSRSGLIQVWKLSERKARLHSSFKFGETKSPAKLLVGHPKCGLLAVASADGTLKMYDSDGRVCNIFRGLCSFGDAITVLRFHDSKQLLSVGTNKGFVYCIDLVRNCVIAIGKGHSSLITDVAFIDLVVKQQSVIAFCSVSLDQKAVLWVLQEITDTCKSECKLEVLQFGNPIPLEEEERSGNLNIVADYLANHQKQLKINPLVTLDIGCEPSSVMMMDRQSIEQCFSDRDEFSASPATFFIAVGGPNGLVTIWDLYNKSKIIDAPDAAARTTFSVPLPGISRMFNYPDAKKFVLIGVDQSLVEWNYERRFEPSHSLQGDGVACIGATSYLQEKNVILLAVNPQGGITKRTIDWRSYSFQVTEMVSLLGEDAAAGIDVSDNGEFIAIASRAGELFIIESETGRVALHVNPGVTGPLQRVCMSRNTGGSTENSFAISLGSDNCIRTWRLGKESERASSDAIANVSQKQLYTMRIDNRDMYVAVGGIDKTLRIYSCKDLNLVASSKNHKQPITECLFSLNSKVLYTAALDNTIKVWSLSDIHNGVIECIKTLTGLQSRATCMTTDKAETRLFVGALDGSIHIWNLKDYTLITVISAHDEAVVTIKNIEYAGVDSYVTVSSDGSIILWKDDSARVNEERIAEDRETTEALNSIDSCLYDKNYLQALKVAVKYRNFKIFERVGEAILGDLSMGYATNDILSDLINSFESDEELEILLLSAIEFLKKPKTLHLAYWLCFGMCKAGAIKRARKINGFAEFCSVFTAKTAPHINRVDLLLEKSYLLNNVTRD